MKARWRWCSSWSFPEEASDVSRSWGTSLPESRTRASGAIRIDLSTTSQRILSRASIKSQHCKGIGSIFRPKGPPRPFSDRLSEPEGPTLARGSHGPPRCALGGGARCDRCRFRASLPCFSSGPKHRGEPGPIETAEGCPCLPATLSRAEPSSPGFVQRMRCVSSH